MQFCGGYNVKGKGSDIRKTFNLPAGTYSVELDFVKIDSWFVKAIRYRFNMLFTAWATVKPNNKIVSI